MSTPTITERRESLLQKKLEVDTKIKSIELDLQRASAQFHATGRGMSTDRYFKLKSQMAPLKRESQGIQFELGKLSRVAHEEREKTVGECFMAVARRELDADMFSRLMFTALGDMDSATARAIHPDDCVMLS